MPVISENSAGSTDGAEGLKIRNSKANHLIHREDAGVFYESTRSVNTQGNSAGKPVPDTVKYSFFMEIGDPEQNASAAIPSGTAVRQIVVFLENRAGALLNVVQLVADTNVIVLGLSVRDSMDSTVVRLIVSDPDLVEPLFIEKGIAFSTTDVLVVELPGGAEQLPDCFRTLVNAETNIHFVYPILTRPNGKAAMVLCAEDNEFGRKVLNTAGYQVLMQEDLSR